MLESAEASMKRAWELVEKSVQAENFVKAQEYWRMAEYRLYSASWQMRVQ